jgi:RimJ/RimL family protein N-acetyltransferase
VGRPDAWVGTLLRGEPLVPTHPWLVPPVLHGRVRLRPHLPDDVPRIVQACSDADTQHWLSSLPAPYLAQDAHRHLAEIAEQHACGRSMYWAVTEPGSDLLIGEVGIFGLGGRSVRGAEIGYWAHPGARNRGHTTAALRLALRHALLPLDDGGLGIARVVVRAAARNAASRRVALAAGLRQTGVDRQAELLRDGTLDDLVRYDLLALELRSRPSP